MRSLALSVMLIGMVPFVVCAQETPLQQFVGSYMVVESTLPAPDAEIEFRSVAGGRGIHSIWKHGSGDDNYEAHALWGYDPETEQVRVLEVNSIGVVEQDIGRIEDGVLTLERYEEDNSSVTERRTLQWTAPDTLEMTLDFVSEEDSVHHEVVIARISE